MNRTFTYPARCADCGTLSLSETDVHLDECPESATHKDDERGLGMDQKITEMWAWIFTDDDGSEGIPAYKMGDDVLPLVGADAERMQSLEGIAQHIADSRNKRVELRRWHGAAELVRTLQPNSVPFDIASMHCVSCGAYLRGSATTHANDCPLSAESLLGSLQ